jgi:hypothetical protein
VPRAKSGLEVVRAIRLLKKKDPNPCLRDPGPLLRAHAPEWRKDNPTALSDGFSSDKSRLICLHVGGPWQMLILTVIFSTIG